MLTKASKRSAAIVVDLGYGDSGKGTMIDWLCAERGVTLVVRFNGGAQAGHNVIAADGRHHTFSQFGAGTFTPGVRTHLSRHCLVNPLSMNVEARALMKKGVPDAYARATVHREALVVTPFHRAANRLSELYRGDARHGSCGMGIGETASHALRHPDEAMRVGDLADPAAFRRKFRLIRERKRAEMREQIAALRGVAEAETSIRLFDNDGVAEAYLDHMDEFLREATLIDDAGEAALFERHDRIAFEGAQGVLLDEKYGFHPHTTWSTCTFENARAILKAHGGDRQVTSLGVIRGYMTRHGAGPFPTEDAALEPLLKGEHNVRNDWQGGFRLGWLDLPAIRYAIKACGNVDALAVTCLDRLTEMPTIKVCVGYDPHPDDRALLTPDVVGVARNIPFREGKDNDRQERITNALKRAKPLYWPWGEPKPDARALLGWLRDELPVPIAIGSYGPTAADKVFNPQ